MLSMFSLKTMLFHFIKTTMPPKNNLFLSKRDQNIVTKVFAFAHFSSFCLLLSILHFAPFQQLYQIHSDVLVHFQASQRFTCSLADNLANCKVTIQHDFYDHCYYHQRLVKQFQWFSPKVPSWIYNLQFADQWLSGPHLIWTVGRCLPGAKRRETITVAKHGCGGGTPNMLHPGLSLLSGCCVSATFSPGKWWPNLGPESERKSFKGRELATTCTPEDSFQVWKTRSLDSWMQATRLSGTASCQGAGTVWFLTSRKAWNMLTWGSLCSWISLSIFLVCISKNDTVWTLGFSNSPFLFSSLFFSSLHIQLPGLG